VRKAPTNKTSAAAARAKVAARAESPDVVLRTDLIPGHLGPEVRSLATTCTNLAELVARSEEIADQLEACAGRLGATNVAHADETTRLREAAHEWMLKAEAAEKRADALTDLAFAVCAALRTRGIVPPDAPLPDPATMAALVSVLFAS
jgi:hypothetical protein